MEVVQSSRVQCRPEAMEKIISAAWEQYEVQARYAEWRVRRECSGREVATGSRGGSFSLQCKTGRSLLFSLHQG